MADTTTEKLKSRSERELEALGEGLSDSPSRKKKKKKKKAQPAEEKKSVGRDFANENAERLIQQVRARLDATTDPDKRADLQERIKRLKASMN